MKDYQYLVGVWGLSAGAEMAGAKWATRSRSCHRQPMESCSTVQYSDTFCIHAARGGRESKRKNGTTVQGVRGLG